MTQTGGVWDNTSNAGTCGGAAEQHQSLAHTPDDWGRTQRVEGVIKLRHQRGRMTNNRDNFNTPGPRSAREIQRPLNQAITEVKEYGPIMLEHRHLGMDRGDFKTPHADTLYQTD